MTTLRNVVGAMTLEETLTSRDQINTQLRIVLDEATEKWGVRVTRVELKSIDPPRSIQEAMEQQMRADRAKRAAILSAEGEKQSAILRAEGLRQAAILNAEADQQSNILRAEGETQARALRAEGEAEALADGVRAPSRETGSPRADMLGYKYLEALPAVADGDANKLMLLPDRRRPTRWAPSPAWAPPSARARAHPDAARQASARHAAAGPAAAGPAGEPIVDGPSTPCRRPLVESGAPVTGRTPSPPRLRSLAAWPPLTAVTLLASAARPGPGRHGHPPAARLGPAPSASTTSTGPSLGVTVTIFVLVGGWLLYSAIRFRERPGDAHVEPPQVHGSTARDRLDDRAGADRAGRPGSATPLDKLPHRQDAPPDSMVDQRHAPSSSRWTFARTPAWRASRPATPPNTLVVPQWTRRSSWR